VGLNPWGQTRLTRLAFSVTRTRFGKSTFAEPIVSVAAHFHDAHLASASSSQPPMHKPKRAALNRIRERRIEQEIVVDAYNEEERAMSWYYYLEEKLEFPFKARCIAPRTISPLKKGEEVEVLAMAQEDDCMREMFVRIEFAGRKLGVPLAQLEPTGADKGTREAAQDWCYWVAMGYGF